MIHVNSCQLTMSGVLNDRRIKTSDKKFVVIWIETLMRLQHFREGSTSLFIEELTWFPSLYSLRTFNEMLAYIIWFQRLYSIARIDVNSINGKSVEIVQFKACDFCEFIIVPIIYLFVLLSCILTLKMFNLVCCKGILCEWYYLAMFFSFQMFCNILE